MDSSWAAPTHVLRPQDAHFQHKAISSIIAREEAPRREYLAANILYLDASRSLYGASRALLTLLQSLDRDRFHPRVLLANDLEEDRRFCAELRRLGVPYREFPLAVLRRKKYLNPLGVLFLGRSLARSVRWLRRAIQAHHVTLVHTNTSTVLSGALAAAFSGVDHIWHVHEILRPGEGHLLALILHALSTRVVVPSAAAARSLLSLTPSLRSRLVVISNGVDPLSFRTVPPQAVARLRSEWGIASDELVVGMVGRIGIWKGEERFVRMAHLVNNALNAPLRARFVVVGGVFERQEHHLARLRSLINVYGLSEQVLVAGLRDDMAVVHNAFDLLVHLPVRPEPFGLVAVEAMSAGKPVVAAATGGLPEIVRDGQTGFLVPPGEAAPDHAAQRVLTLLNDAELRARMGRAASKRVDTEFSAALYAARFHKLYSSIAGSK